MDHQNLQINSYSWSNPFEIKWFFRFKKTRKNIENIFK